jgi:ABC-type polysaccharide/polyol phosphate export permease
MPDMNTKGVVDVRDLPPMAMRMLLRGIDSAIGFIALERMLILRNIKIVAAGNISRAFISTFRLFVVIDAHVYLYYVIQRTMPGTISFLDYNSSAFALWSIFGSMTHKAVSPALGAHYNLALNVRWINLFIADLVWEITKALLAVSAVYVQFLVFTDLSVAPITHTPNMPLLLATFLLIGAIGSGFGLVLHSARRRWPIIDATMEAMMWFLFVTSGIYESYVQLPAVIGEYYRWNPVMVVIEYGRLAMDPGYPVGDLDLAYPVIIAVVLLALGLLLRQSDARGKRP